ncbi:MAG: S-methyl-5'-thioadenosine phosphorylase [Lentisphaerae bacterium]|nr:S-methyl-5'-thioadenosine phosphorylase [Lentisphaerota bacterium]
MTVGIIGGSGLYAIDGIEGVERRRICTAFGETSDEIVTGRLEGVDVCFLPRHGAGHRILPSEINHRANIMALKMLGADSVISVSAVGSLRENMRPRDIVLPDQYFDRTKRHEDHTFFGRGVVAHVSFGQPACPALRGWLAEAAAEVIEAQGGGSPVVFAKGTYVNMEGPAFSTRAESEFHRRMGFDIVGMTSLAEAKLCREAEMCYQAMALVTDYDCWHETEGEVSVEMLIDHLRANSDLAMRILPGLLRRVSDGRDCRCRNALSTAVVTDLSTAPKATLEALKPILGRLTGA